MNPKDIKTLKEPKETKAPEKGPLDIETVDAVLQIPKNAVELKITAKIYENDELFEAESKFDLSEIKEAVDLFEQTMAGEYPRFALTEKGHELAAQLAKAEEDGQWHGTSAVNAVRSSTTRSAMGAGPKPGTPARSAGARTSRPRGSACAAVRTSSTASCSTVSCAATA